MPPFPFVSALQILGITSSAAIAGASAAQSVLVVPSLNVAPPALLARQFANLVTTSTRLIRPANAATSLAFAWLAYTSYASPESFPTSSTPGSYGGIAEWHLFTAAAIINALVTPFTLLTIVPINDRMAMLARKTEGAVAKTDAEVGILSEVDQDEVKFLVTRWISLNYFRCFFPLAASLTASWTCAR